MCAVLGAGIALARAEDTPDQAAARAALQQKMFELGHPPAPPAAGQPMATWSDPAGPTANPPAAPATHAAPAAAIVPDAPPAVAMAAPAPAARPRPAARPPRPPANLIITGTKAADPGTGAILTSDILANSGFTYRDAHVEKVEGDGLVISYTPAGGGLVITKLSFSDLPAQVRQQYEKN